MTLVSNLPAEPLQDTSPAFDKDAHSGSEILPGIFVILFVQLLCLLAISLLTQSGPQLVSPSAFAFDYHDFYIAANDYLKSINPYVRGRFYTPPSSILVCLPFSWLPFKIAGMLFFIINITLVFLSIREFSRHVGLSRENEFALIGIVTLYYPFYFLIQRGNLDGIMLALLVYGFRAKSQMARVLLLGASLATKLYSGLLVAIMFRKRQWKVATLAVVFSCLLQIPFLHLLRPFLGAILGRSSQLRFLENISPAVFANALFEGFGNKSWKLAFVFFWGGTLLLRLARDRDSEISANWPAYTPWMISLPTLVYAYSGVLALCPLGLIASACQHRKIAAAELLVVIGCVLLGFQAIAWTAYLETIASSVQLVHLIPAAGTLFMILGACNLPMYRSAPVGS